jgi:hypothetical protein
MIIDTLNFSEGVNRDILSSCNKKDRTGFGFNNCWPNEFCFLMLNAPFNNISVISWRSVLIVEETELTGE